MVTTDNIGAGFPFAHYALKSIAIIILIYLAGGLIIGILSASLKLNAFDIILNSAMDIVALLIPALYFASKTTEKTTTLLKLNKVPKWIFIYYSLVGLIGLQLFSTGFLSIQQSLVPAKLAALFEQLNDYFDSLYNKLLGGYGSADFLKALICGAMIPAMSEETVFRGFLQGSLEKSWGYHKAIIISALIFSLLHLHPINFIPLMAIGIFLGYSSFSSGSIYTAIMIHVLNNSLAIIALYSKDLTKLNDNIKYLPLYQSIPVFIAGIMITVFAIRQMLIKRKENQNEESI